MVESPILVSRGLFPTATSALFPCALVLMWAWLHLPLVFTFCDPQFMDCLDIASRILVWIELALRTFELALRTAAS